MNEVLQQFYYFTDRAVLLLFPISDEINSAILSVMNDRQQQMKSFFFLYNYLELYGTM